MSTQERIEELRQLVAELEHASNAASVLQYFRLKAQLQDLEQEEKQACQT